MRAVARAAGEMAGVVVLKMNPGNYLPTNNFLFSSTEACSTSMR
jgi:hypothetical protein